MKKLLLICIIIITVFTSSNYLFAQAGTAINFQNATFNSHGDFIYCGSPAFELTNKITVTAWIKWTTDPKLWSVANHDEREGQYSTYLAYATHNTLDITTEHGLFWLRNTKTSNKVQFMVENSSGTKATATSSTSLSSGTWYFLAGTYDGTNVRLYLNGTLEDNAGLTGNIRANTDCRLNMGRIPWGYGFYVGYMDEVRVWNVALSQTDIQNQMNSKATINDANCKSYWDFDDGSGTVIYDSKGLANGVFYSGLVDVHGGSVDLPNKIIQDADRAFVTGAWNGKTLYTVAGAGVDETNSIVSNTGNVFTLTNGFAGSAPDNLTTPVLDNIVNMTWFGILDASESSQWVSSSDLTLPVSLVSFTAGVQGNAVVLKWQTASETDNLGFILERAEGNGAWLPLASYKTDAALKGQGNKSTTTSYVWNDAAVTAGKQYRYRLGDVNTAGVVTMHSPITVTTTALPQSTAMLNAYPNPFNPETTVKYTLHQDAQVTITVYDLLGRKVKTLIDEQQPAGAYQAVWNGTDAVGAKAASGAYLVRMETAEVTQIQKVLLLK
ncbi:MAG TPA: FlgD immunoglobulin-like domain containing protein [bacterium]|nr:FlgD immunoglobulin-like domain containing protein [bacterium]HPN44681.1 FlgD immunoglobulin-like domain containing protein [bacterium]